MGFFFGKGKSGRGIPQNATFRLTESGREKLLEFSGDPKSQVLVVLETRGTCDLDEISQSAGMGRGQVERIIPVLIRGGYIQYVGAAGATGSEDAG